MTTELQKQIKDNASDISSYRGDLMRWEEDLEKKEVRRDRKRRGDNTLPPPPTGPAKPKAPTENEACAEAALKAMAAAAGVKVREEGQGEDEESAPIKRDGLAMHQYYSSWDQLDVDAEVERLDEEAHEQQRIERQARQSDKDRILDEMAINGDGDRIRTSKAKPRVKVQVRMSGRRASPVDLAEPRRIEANGYFSSGRYREAVHAYSCALELLEKYEPPGERPKQDAAEGEEVQEDTKGKVGDCAGQETEALLLKTTLLANRAAAALKLEEWRLVIDDCTDALRFDPKHGKATLRRGWAYARLKRWAPAARDLEAAVAWDPADKKAAAELGMARRMLQEQAKEAREHARRAICDPTRQPTMPTRRLTVRVQRAGGSGQQEEPTARAATGAAEATASSASSAPPPGPEGAPAPVPAPERKPYVPRAVRMRGGRNAAPPADAAAGGGGYPTQGSAGSGAGDAARRSRGGATAGVAPMNFYTFEGLWGRSRARPGERLALLRRVGAASLPALFRESLDSELVASIAEVLSSEVAGSGEASEVEFGVEVMSALARTSRFDLSYQGLSQSERGVCLSMLDRLAEASGGGGSEALEARARQLRQSYAEAAAPAAKDEGEDEDDVAEEPVARTAPAAAAPSSAAAAAEAAQAPPMAMAPPVAAAGGIAVGAFSLDDCD